LHRTDAGVPLLLVCVVAFVFGFVGSMPLAGPVSVLVVSNAFRGRFKNAIALDLGASVAEGFYAFLAFWGFATFLAKYEKILPVAHAVTAIAFLVLGAYFLCWKPTERRKIDKQASFWVGLSVSMLNPTLLVTWTTAVTWLYARRVVDMTGALAIPWGVAAAAGVATWFVLLVALIKHFHERFPKQAITWIIRGMGLALIGLSAWSVVEFLKSFTK
jgi:threonine/homoserine/homoserine lactone efflux protein